MKKIPLTYIIDDDNIFVFILKKSLEKNQSFLEVLNFNDGQSFLERLQEKCFIVPDIILLDINMPVLDGWQVLEQIEKLPNKDKLNIVVMSSSVDVSDIERAKTFSTVRNFISKPFNKEKLNQLLEMI